MATIDTQLTKIWVIPAPATDFADCAAAGTALLGGKEVQCTQSIADIVRTREVKESTCINKDEVKVSLGAIKYDALEVGMFFDPSDVEGQKLIKDAMESGDMLTIGIELSDRDTVIGTTGVQGSLFWFNVKVSGDSILLPNDELVGYSATLNIDGSLHECPAIAGAA